MYRYPPTFVSNLCTQVKGKRVWRCGIPNASTVTYVRTGCVVRAVVIIRSTAEQIATVAPQLGARRVKSVFQPVPIMLEQSKLYFTVLVFIVLKTLSPASGCWCDDKLVICVHISEPVILSDFWHVCEASVCQIKNWTVCVQDRGKCSDVVGKAETFNIWSCNA